MSPIRSISQSQGAHNYVEDRTSPHTERGALVSHCSTAGATDRNTPANDQSQTVAVTETNNNHTNTQMYKSKGKKYHQLQLMIRRVQEKLAYARSKYAHKRVFRLNQTEAFYSCLCSWLKDVRKGSLIKSFQAEEIQSDIEVFESLMDELSAAEDNGDESEIEGINNAIGCFVQECIEQCS